MLKGLRKKASILSLGSISSSSAATTTSVNNEANYDKILNQVHDFEIALKAMDFLLDDHTEQGFSLLKKEAIRTKNHDQPQAIFPLAKGVIEFIEATLGFEPEVMAKAHNTLSEAETASLNNSKYNVKHQMATSNIYPPGTEFQVTYAEATLLNALLMLLTENNGVVEGAKALFKLRRAYQTLDAVYKRIKESEPIFNKNLAKLKKEAAGIAATNSLAGLRSGGGGGPGAGGSFTSLNRSISTVDLPGYASSSSSSSSTLPQDLKLIKDLEKIYMMRKSRIEGSNLNSTGHQINLFQGLEGESVSTVALTKGSGEISKLTTPPLSASEQEQEQKENEEEEEDDDDDDEFADASSTLDDLPSTLEDLPTAINGANSSSAESFVSSMESSVSTGESDNMYVSTVDEFIHSGVQLCFGILQVVLSLIPPTIGKVLSIVGFKGDRDTGLKLLWKTAITCRNIHGELALLCLLVFYDGPIQFVDVGFQLPGNEDCNIKNIIQLENKIVVSEEELTTILKNPSLYTNQILNRARNLFPHNALWILQQGRILAAQGQIAKATELMQDFTDDTNNTIQMQQVEALLVFDRAMAYMFQHEFDKAARDMIYLIEINSWSKAVYLFMASACYLEKYRMIKMDMIKVDDKSAELKKYSKLFDKYLDLALSYVPGQGINAATKKGGIGGSNKQMPFDKFLLRKYKHLQERKKQYPKLPMVDLVGTSLVYELVYFWNGYNRMSQSNLQDCLKALGYSGAIDSEYSANTLTDKYALVEETQDEAMIRYFLQSICLRSLGKTEQGVSLLDNHVLSKYVISDLPQFKFHKMTYSPYLYPTALYEKTMFIWILRTKGKSNIDVKSVVAESKSWLTKAELVGEGDYELSNRTGMRIKAAGDRLDQLGSSG
ncbi:Mitochondrial outer membrane protein IML2 [Spathaspora sp. JA1]|nr:Mitochondrial outer membrane protein IML2 [Spathaspora sp. JA1]